MKHRGSGHISLSKYPGIIVTIFIIVCIVFVFMLLWLAIIWLRHLKQVKKELSFATGVYTGPAGDPWWDGKLPEKVDDFTKPRYVYQNLKESTEYLPENGKIIGYRISPTLVIHSRIQDGVNSAVLYQYIHRFNGKLLLKEDVSILRLHWNEVSELRVKAGDTPLDAKWFWCFDQDIPCVTHYQKDSYKYIMQFYDAWYTLILKR